MSLACSGDGGVVEAGDDVEEFVEVIVYEDGFGSFGGDGGEG